MKCSDCSTMNDADGRFCKQCGKPLARAATATLAQVEEKIEDLIQEALRLYEQARYDEALLACEGVLVLDSENVTALSLKGLIHEKRGEIALAIEAFEKVILLNPLSVADRAKLEALKNHHHAQPDLSRMPQAKKSLWMELMPTAVALTAAAALLVFGLWLTFRWSSTLARTATPTPENPPVQTAWNPDASQPNATPNSQPQPSIVQPPATVTPLEDSRANRSLQNPSEGTLPPLAIDPSRLALMPESNATANLNTTIPTLPSNRPNGSQRQNNGTLPPPPNNSQQDDGTIVMPDVDLDKKQEPDRGVYDIQITRREGSSTNSGSNTRPPSVNSLLQTAQQLQMAGNYRQAIATYERAVPQIQYPGEVYQQIALCYYRLGEKSNAKQYYQLAIDKLQAQIQANYEPARARAALQACQQGLALCEE